VVHVVLMLVVRVRCPGYSTGSSNAATARLMVVVVMMMMVMQGICAGIETRKLLLQSSNCHGICSHAARSTYCRRTYRSHVQTVG